jgi:anthranilate synthase component I
VANRITELLGMTMISPSLEKFRRLAERGNLIPVVAEIVSDVETPVGAFQKIGRNEFSFLFESAERNEESGRFSFIGIDPLLIVSQRDADLTTREKSGAATNRSTTDPLGDLQKILGEFRFVPRDDIPHFQGGAVGFIGYDVIRFFESKAPIHSQDDLGLPEMMFVIAGTLIVFDHRFRLMRIIVAADVRKQSEEDAYAGANKQIEALLEKLAAPSRLRPINAPAAGDTPTATGFQSNTSDFEKMVLRAKEYIAEGDIFQAVLSQRFESEFSGDPLDLYRCLRFGNPSPYMFLLNFGDEFCALGSSPELHVRVRGRTAELRPIAGTRPRGVSAISDEANARELLADPKERAEHVMLIDLARNDLGRIAQIGSVRVTEQMTIERYSHVMHIVSHVEARLRDGLNAFDAFRSTFPAGTVSGAPKIRAMQIIAELEQTRRGFYAGAVGWFGFDGNCDSCIALRSVVLKNGKAFVQAGAGIVADSEPAREREETERKAMAVLAAIARAKKLSR